jgi:hypothetical protein
MLANLLGGFIIILIGVNLTPTIANSVAFAVGNSTKATNVTGSSLAVANLITIFWALGVMSAGVAVAMVGLKDSGLI